MSDVNSPTLHTESTDHKQKDGLHVNIMKEGKDKKARRKLSPKTAEPQSGTRSAVKSLPGAKPLAKLQPRTRAAPTSTRAQSLLKPLKTLESHLSGVFGLPTPAPNLL